MRKLPFLIMFAVLFLAGCSTMESSTEVVEAAVEPPAVKQVEAPAAEPEPEPQPSPEPEPVPEPEPEPEPRELTPQEQEFLRSTEALDDGSTISMDTFMKDKEDVLDTIDKLAEIMKKGDYNRWLSYVSAESKEYWTNPDHLKEIAKRLPVKGLKISGLRDYFKYIFVPSRTGRRVDEIRYISDTTVKAVQVKGDHDVVYYTFEKIDGKWLLKLDTL